MAIKISCVHHKFRESSVVASFASKNLCQNVPLGFRFVVTNHKADISSSLTFAGTLIQKQGVFCQREGVLHRSMDAPRWNPRANLTHMQGTFVARHLLCKASFKAPFMQGIFQGTFSTGAFGLKRSRPQMKTMPPHIRKRPHIGRLQGIFLGAFDFEIMLRTLSNIFDQDENTPTSFLLEGVELNTWATNGTCRSGIDEERFQQR